MKLFFDWCESLSEEKTNWRGDEHIVSLQIFQKEMSFASAKIKFVATKNQMKKYAKIALKQGDKFHVLFAGRIIGFPVGFNSSTVQIEMIAEPENHQQQLNNFIENQSKQDLHNTYNELINIDNLFYSDSDLKNPTTLLEGGNQIFFWNANTGKMSLSNIAKGRRVIEITPDKILQNSIKVRLAREPYSAINVSVNVNWIKHQHIAIDVLPLIAQHFREPYINSFTDIKADFAKIDNCSFCNIREVNPNTLGCLTDYPLKSNDFLIDGKKYNFKRFYYDGNIIFNLNYSKRLFETANFSVKTNQKHNNIKQLHFVLNDIQLPKKYPHWRAYFHYYIDDIVQNNGHVWKCTSSHHAQRDFNAEKWNKIAKIPDALSDDSCNSFFETQRGKNALKYAAQKALALLNYSQRYMEVEFKVLFRDFFDISVDDEIILKNASDYCKEIRGKVIRTQIIATTKQNFVQITIGCGSIDNSSWDKIKNWDPEICVKNENISIDDVVRSIEIINPPEKQMETLRQYNGNSISELMKVLQRVSTKIKVIMRPQNNIITEHKNINIPNITIG